MAPVRPSTPPAIARSDTIYALSSGPAPAAIAVIRISGPAAPAALTALAGAVPIPRVATLRTLRDARGDTLDRGLILFFPAPASATGEDVGELHVHGGVAVIRAVLAALGQRGLRHAEPGEFTRRAVLNGRLDLVQAEGLADLLDAETEARRREALLRATGALTRRLRRWTDEVVTLCARVEAAIDHDEADDASDLAEIWQAAAVLARDVARELRKPSADRLRDGIRVAIVGPTNAGKSSLFNALVGDEAAIVSPIAGTTRDLIERPVAFGGVPFIVCDTAGLRASDDAIEQLGITRARAARDAADLVLDLASDAENDGKTIAVSAKVDLAVGRPGTIAVSNVTGEGIADLISAMLDAAKHLLPAEYEPAMVERQRLAAGHAHDHLAAAATADDMAVAAEHLRAARLALDRVIGGGDLEDVFDTLFSRFCLGK